MKYVTIALLLASGFSRADPEKTSAAKKTLPTLSGDALRTFEAQAPTIKDRPVKDRSFDTFVYDKVIAYDYEPEDEEPIVLDGKFAKRVFKQRALTQKQTENMLDVVGRASTYGGDFAACFDPHLGLVFYKDHQIVGELSVCFECNYLRSSMEIPASTSTDVKSGSATFPHFGFSPSGKAALMGLCNELGFSHCKPS